MNLWSLLAEKRSSLNKKWINLIFETYPGDTQKFFSKEKDRFANPVGQTIKKEVEHLYDELVKDVLDLQNVSSCLDNIIRIRAVQDFKPSHAIGFILQLKKLIREELENKASINGLSDELRTLESRIDDVALLAFDIYSQCRQKIYELRVNEVKNQVSRLLSRANLLSEIPEQEPDL
jgi:archaellum component FlaC